MKTKVHGTTILAVALAMACMLTGCASGAAAPSAPIQPTATIRAQSTQDAEASEACTAFGSSETPTPEQLAAQKKERQDEIEQHYAIYAPFGLTYDRAKDLFFFEGKVVRYFKDAVSLSETNGFFHESGVLDLTGQRNAAGELIGLVKATQEEFDARTAEREKLQREFDGAVGEVSEAVTFEVGDPGARDHSLDPYTSYGVSYDEGMRSWLFDGKPIHLFFDEGHLTLTNEAVKNGINVRVIRNGNGEIEKLTEMTEADIQKIAE